MISGGSTDGDSNRARKTWSRNESFGVGSSTRAEGPVINFGPHDIQGVNFPHNDALVSRATLAKYKITRVFVDLGISMNIIFEKAFSQMELDDHKLEAVDTALFGFARHTIYPRGHIFLSLTLRVGDSRKTMMTLFTVVDAPSSYNNIL